MMILSNNYRINNNTHPLLVHNMAMLISPAITQNTEYRLYFIRNLADGKGHKWVDTGL